MVLLLLQDVPPPPPPSPPPPPPAISAPPSEAAKSLASSKHKLHLRLGEELQSGNIKVTTSKALILWLCLVALFLLVLPHLYRRRRRPKPGQRSD